MYTDPPALVGYDADSLTYRYSVSYTLGSTKKCPTGQNLQQL